MKANPSRLERLWAASGLVFLASFIAGALASGFNPLGSSIDEINEYITDNRARTYVLHFSHTTAAVSFFAFGAYVRTVLAQKQQNAAGNLAALAYSGAVMTAVFTLLNLGYLTGGVGIMIPLAVFTGSTSLWGLQSDGILPRWLNWAGLVLASLALGAPKSLLVEAADWNMLIGGPLLFLVPLIFLWIFITSIVLLFGPQVLSLPEPLIQRARDVTMLPLSKTFLQRRVPVPIPVRRRSRVRPVRPLPPTDWRRYY